MKIREIRAVGLRGDTHEGGWSEELVQDDCVHTLIAVLTDEGVTGVGSVYTSDALVKGSLGVLQHLYEDESAIEPERVTEKLRQHTFWQGRGGAIEHTISGIDIALWDILGQVTGQPIGRLLGGRYRERVKPYASIIMRDPEPLKDYMLSLKAQGFRAFKMGWGPFGRVNRQTDEAIVKAAREAVGPDILLMVDAGGSDGFWPHGYKWALNTAHMLADYDITWFEEPLKPDAIEDYARLREHSLVPISGGEVLTRRQAFLPWLRDGALDIVQPDVTKVGGITESRRIAWMAMDYGVRMIPHGWNTAVGLATDLQLASAFPETDLIEYLTGSVYIDAITKEPWQLDEDGMLSIPAKPGLGIELDPEAIYRYSGVKDFLTN